MRAVYLALPVLAAVSLGVVSLFNASHVEGVGRRAEPIVETAGIPVPPLADAPERNAQGLKLTIATKTAPPQTDCRSTRLAGLYVPEGTPPSPFLAVGPFTATWEGNLFSKIRDEYTFSADGSGSLVLEVNGEKVLETSGADLSATKGKVIRLNKGKNKITARYTSPEKGDASVRLFWENADFPREPLPIVDLSHNADEKDLCEARRMREGRELFATLRCNKCHDSSALVPVPATHGEDGVGEGMPELGIDAPSLADIGGRVNMNWIATWLKNPRALRPESSMPQLIRGADAEKQALDIAGYLSSLGNKTEPPPAPPAEEVIKEGGGIVARLGCIACHTLPDKEEVAADRIPFRYVRAKWKPSALREFLKQPDKHYQWIRMPNFRFTDDEIAKVSAYLLYSKVPEGQKWLVEQPKGAPDVAHGKSLVESVGCLNCHNIGTPPAAPVKAPALKEDAGWAKGCLATADDARGKAPNFSLSQAQHDALLSFVAAGKNSLKQESIPEFAERQFRTLRCWACHKRDDQEDLWSSVDGETEAIKTPDPEPAAPAAGADPNAGAEPKLVEQNRPILTWTGEKLKPEWLAQFIGGKIPYKPRPWIFARMPGFPKRADLIAKGLVVEHGYTPVSPPDPAPNAELAETGKKLVAKNGGFSCTQCHSVGNTEAVGVFEAPAINFAYVKYRILKTYFHRWIRDPQRVELNSKMPTFAKEGGKTSLTDYFDGDATKQFEAIWQYLLAGDKIVAPEE